MSAKNTLVLYCILMELVALLGQFVKLTIFFFVNQLLKSMVHLLERHLPHKSFQQYWSACLQILINYLDSVCLSSYFQYSAHLRTLMFRMSKWFADFWERQIKCFHCRKHYNPLQHLSS